MVVNHLSRCLFFYFMILLTTELHSNDYLVSKFYKFKDYQDFITPLMLIISHNRQSLVILVIISYFATTVR